MRYQIAENCYIVGKFITGDAVTIALYKLSDGSGVGLDDNSCTEIGATGVFRWHTSNITVAPVSFTEYLWIMDNGVFLQYGKIVLGGYTDDVDQALSTTESNIRGADSDDLKDISDEIGALNDPSAADVADAVWNESKTGHTGDLKTMADDIDQSLSTTESNIRGADGDDLKDISDEIAALPSVADIADGVWDESKAGHTGDLKTMADDVDQSLSTTESNIRGADSDDLKTISDQIDGLNDPTVAQIADGVWDELLAGHTTADTFAQALWRLFKIGKNRWQRTGTTWILYDDDGTTALYTFDLKKADGTAAGENNPAYERVPA